MLPCVAPPGRALVVFSGRTGGQPGAGVDKPLLCVVEGGRILIRRTQKPSNEIQQELLLGASHH